jgi:hypothetical protein
MSARHVLRSRRSPWRISKHPPATGDAERWVSLRQRLVQLCRLCC